MEEKEIRCIDCGRTCEECGLDTLGSVEGRGLVPLRELVEKRYELWFVCEKCSEKPFSKGNGWSPVKQPKWLKTDGVNMVYEGIEQITIHNDAEPHYPTPRLVVKGFRLLDADEIKGWLKDMEEDLAEKARFRGWVKNHLENI